MSAVRPARSDELPRLKALWQRVFGDEAAFVELFYKRLLPCSTALAAERDGEAAGAAYIVKGFALVLPDGAALPCDYIYAVAVDEAARGLGLGKALSLEAARLCERGKRLSCLVPASERLFDFYARCAGYVPAFTVCEGEAPAKGACETSPLSPAEYLRLREDCLRGWGHLRPSPEVMDFWEETLRMEGGGFFRLTLPGGTSALAAAEKAEGTLFLKELLCPPGQEANFAAAFAARMKAPSCRWRCPSGGAGLERPFGMLSVNAGSGFYFGPAFD